MVKVKRLPDHVGSIASKTHAAIDESFLSFSVIVLVKTLLIIDEMLTIIKQFYYSSCGFE